MTILYICLMRNKIFVLCFFIAFLLSSCAIHPYFPFICFKKECIQSQFNTGVKPTGGRRGIKQQFKMLNTKIKKKKAKNKRAKSGDLAGRSRISDSKLDSLIKDTSRVDDYIKMIIYHKVESPEKRVDKDSVYIKSSFLQLSKEDKALINYYLEKYPVKDIKEILLMLTVESPEDIDTKKRSGMMKARRLRNSLIKAGVKEEKIKIK